MGSVALAAVLLWLSVRHADFSRLRDTLAGADWRWIVPIAVVTIGSHALRAWRWTLLLDTLPDAQPDQPRAGFWLAFGATMIGYLVNTAIPRGGEVARAGNVAARTSAGFPAVMGTVVVERVIDVLTLALALLTLPLLFGNRLNAIRASVERGVAGILPHGPALWVAIAVGGIALLLAAALLLRRRGAGGGKVAGLLRGFRDGLVSLARVRRRGALVASTAGIWACYVLMSDFPLRMLGIHHEYGLTLLDAWGVMNIGAVGMAMPAPGGTGSYHFAVVQALGLLSGVPETPAAAFALLTHGAQLALFAVAGVAALLIQGAGMARRPPPAE